MERAIGRSQREIVSTLSGLVGYHLRRASAAMVSDLSRHLEPHGLRASEASVLLLIRDNPHITQSEIGRELGIKRANMAPLSAILERRGLIARTRVDGRSQGLSLTEEGQRLADIALREMEANDARFFGKLEAEDRRKFEAFLDSAWG